jgi:hypothetical protein
MAKATTRIEIGKGPASEAEAAAVAAAIERFAADTAPPPATSRQGMDPWLKAALIDGVSAKVEFGPGSPIGRD